MPESTGSNDDRKLVTYSMNPYLVDDHVSYLGIENPSDRSRWREEFRSEFLAESGKFNKCCDTLLLTSEHFHSRLDSKENVKTLFNLLSEVCSDFKVIVYLRRQDRVATSLASTYFKSGHTGGINGYRRHLQGLITNSRYFDYRHLLSIWSDVFGAKAISPRIFSKDKFHDHDLLSDFTNAAGIPLEQPATLEVEHSNVSLSDSAIMALETFSEFFPDDGVGEKLLSSHSLRNRFIQYLEDELSGYPNVFNQNDAELFYSQFRSSNNEIARQWFDSEPLFEEDFSIYPKNLEDSLDLSSQLKTVMAFFANEFEFTRSELDRLSKRDHVAGEPTVTKT